MKKIILIGIIVILIVSAGLVLAQGGGKEKSPIEWCILIPPSGIEIKVPCKIAEKLPPDLPITVGKIIDSCPYEINSSGHYILTKDLEATDYCIWIRPPEGEYRLSDVTLDCRGHQIIGSGITDITDGNFGILIYGGDDITVKNCQVLNFYYGIQTIDAWNIDIMDNIIENTNFGIFLTEDYQNRIVGNTVKKSSQGIVVYFGSGYASVQNNEVYDNEVGIFVDIHCQNNLISENKVFYNSIGIKFSHSTYPPYPYGYEGNEVKDNDVCGNTSYDFWCSCLREEEGICSQYYPVVDGGGNACTTPDNCAISCSPCE